MVPVQHVATAPVRLRRAGWLVLGALVATFAVFEVVKHDLGPLPILLFAVMPDLTMLAGAGQRHQPGQLPPRAVPLYNAAHHPMLPIALVAVVSLGIIEGLDPFWFVGGLTWLAHIAFDRAVGFGPRTPDGWQRG